MPETFFTVWHNVFQRGALQPGETLLVHGGASGIGTTAIQLAEAFGACGDRDRRLGGEMRRLPRLGADRAVNYHREDFVAAVKEATGGNGADSSSTWSAATMSLRNYEAAAVDGRIVQIATQKGPVASTDFAKLMVKRLTHTGSTLRPRTVAFKAELAAPSKREVWPLLATRRVAPVMDMIFPLAEAWRAHGRMEGGEHIGKIVLDVA